MQEYFAKRFDTDEPVCVQVDDRRITSVQKADHTAITAAGLSPGRLPVIGPGLFDVQINGGGGVEFSSDTLTEADVLSVFNRVMKQGVFRFCPTVTTNSPETIKHAMKTIVDTIESHPEYAEFMVGIHLEGPFISQTDGARGAHPKEHCRPYDLALFDEFQRAARGMIRIVTLSPEYEGAEEFIEELRDSGVLVALGHTNATALQIVQAADAGAKFSTHLSNATQHLLPKLENYFFAQMTDDRLMAGMIADGFHVSPMLMQIILRTKGANRLVLVSDQASVAGLPPGKHKTGLCELEILPNGKIAMANDAHLLAGASSPLSSGMANLMTIGPLTLKEVYPMVTEHPANLLDLPKYSNTDDMEQDFLTVGTWADFILFKVKPAEYGEFGIADTANFQSGSFEFKSIIYRGKERLK